MTLKSIIQQNITEYTGLDKIYSIVTDIKLYKISTIDRQLRAMTEAKMIKPKFKGNYIIGYEPLVLFKTPSHKPYKPIVDDLDEKLTNILQNIKPSWDNFQEIKTLRDTIKSKSDYNKKELIKQYEKL